MKLTVWPTMYEAECGAECGAEWEVRLLNVRLNMKLTVWPTMRLNGRLLNGRLLNGRLLNVWLSGG